MVNGLKKRLSQGLDVTSVQIQEVTDDDETDDDEAVNEDKVNDDLAKWVEQNPMPQTSRAGSDAWGEWYERKCAAEKIRKSADTIEG